MDFVETATSTFLTSLDIGAVKMYPCGLNTFPDYSIGDRIGVECTRLVDRVEKNGRLFNCNELEPSIVQSLESTFKSLPFGNLTTSFFVCLDFDIDVDLRVTKKELKAYMVSLARSSEILPHRRKISESLEIELLRSSKVFEVPFVLGAMNNRDGAGWVLDQLSSQTRDAIKRKAPKLEKSRHLFGEWWLALSGSVSIGLTESYVEFVTSEIRGTQGWSNILLIDPNEPLRSKIIGIK
jgi:hypothetical protein